MEESTEKSNRPPNDPFRQQKLKAWQPIMTPLKVVAIFVAIGVAFIPTGTTLLSTSDKIYEDSIMYDGANQVLDCAVSEQNQGRKCIATFTLSKDVTGPLYVYYELENYYQNHRKYVNSRDPYQLGGSNLQESALTSTCISDITNGSLVLNPCGLIANSFFTDMFSLSGQSNYTMNETSIAWPSDKEKFIQVSGFKSMKVTPGDESTCESYYGLPCGTYTASNGTVYYYYYPSASTTQYLYQTYPDQISPIEGVTNEHFMVWMRTAALPTFRKLYGIIDGNFKQGQQLEFTIVANYEVDSFSGSKSLVISSIGEFGGRNPYLGIAYVVVGSISLMFAFLFATKQLLSPRAIADPSLLNWN